MAKIKGKRKLLNGTNIKIIVTLLLDWENENTKQKEKEIQWSR